MRHLVAAGALVVLVAAVYGGTIGHEFVFDDWHLVESNDVLAWPLERFPDLLRHAPRGGVSYRPVRIVSYMVDYRIAGGVDPAVFHASNVVYHAAAVLALYVLALRTIGSFPGALFAAALFAVHPLSTECVAYVAGRRDLLATLFGLLSLLAWWSLLEASGRRTEGARSFLRTALLVAGIVLFAVLALASKETAAVVPLLAALLGVLHFRRSGRRTTAITWAGLSIAVVVLWAVIQVLYADRVAEAWSRLSGEPLAPQPALTLHVLAEYVRLVVWPVTLSADYTPPAFPLPASSFDAASVAYAGVLLVVLAAGVILTWRGEIAGAGLLWFLIALLPVAQIVPYREVLAEHNAYLAIAGVALAAGQGLTLVLRHAPRIAVAGASLAILLLAVRAHARTADWRDDETLWKATLATTPSSLRARLHLGLVYSDDGRLLEAQSALREAMEIDPNDPDVLLTLARITEKIGSRDEALQLAERAVAARRDAEALTFLGEAQRAAGSLTAARKSFEQALELDPRFEDARKGLEALRPGTAAAGGAS